MYKYILISVAALTFSVGAAWLIMKPTIQEKEDIVVAPPAVSPTPVAFVSAESGESVFVTFGTSTALLNGSGYSNVQLVQVEAASGAKYESTAENLTLWNKETEVTLTRGRKIIFVGHSEDTSLPQFETASSTGSTTATATLQGEWLWVETIKEDKTIIPKKVGVFSIGFSDNRITGTTDCNGFSGAYEKNENSITIGALATTKMFCEASQEMEFTQLFIGSLTVEQSGRTLTLVHTDGTVSTFELK